LKIIADCRLGGDSIQGLMDTNSPSQILLPNIQALLVTLLFCSKPRQLLDLGSGCGSIERFCIKKLPDVMITSLESTEVIIQLAKEFLIGDECQIVNTSAEVFLASEKRSYDITLCDIFNSEEHPVCLYDDAFYKNMDNSLNNKGVLAINVLSESEHNMLRILSLMKNHFDNISCLEVPDYFNVILFTSNFRLPEITDLEIYAEQYLNKTDLDLRDLTKKSNRVVEEIST